MSKHALLSPSAAHRWLNCPPSARLCEDIADQTSAYAEEGSQAHELCEYKFKKFLGGKSKDPRGNLDYYDQTMEDATDDYLSFCTAEFERLKAHGEPFMAVEQRVRYEEYAPEGSGSADCVIIGDGEMVVCDFKYGAGIAVSAEDNPQLRLYALGYWRSMPSTTSRPSRCASSSPAETTSAQPPCPRMSFTLGRRRS